MLLMHGLSYGPALTRNTKERASACQSDQVGLRPPRVTSPTMANFLDSGTGFWEFNYAGEACEARVY